MVGIGDHYQLSLIFCHAHRTLCLFGVVAVRVFNFICKLSIRKGKPTERWRRKAIGAKMYVSMHDASQLPTTDARFFDLF